MLQAPVEDACHVLGPLARREAFLFLESREPVVRVFFAHDEKRRSLLANGEPSSDLRAPVLHGHYSLTLTLPSSTKTS